MVDGRDLAVSSREAEPKPTATIYTEYVGFECFIPREMTDKERDMLNEAYFNENYYLQRF